MKRITFEASDKMVAKMDEAAFREGLLSRSEFLRFLVATYCRENGISTGESEAYEKASAQRKGEKFGNKHENEEVDLEFGIPLPIIREIEEEARRRVKDEGTSPENVPRPRS